jgi:hypothetical protein
MLSSSSCRLNWNIVTPARKTTAISLQDSTDNGEVSWYDATVTSTEPACPSGKSLLWKVKLEDPSSSMSYTTPGQFLQLRRNHTTDPLFLAMSSSPSSSKQEHEKYDYEFLVKTTPSIPWLTEITSNMNVQVSNVMGS